MRRRVRAAFCVVALGLAACSSDDDSQDADDADHDHNAMEAGERGEVPSSVDPEDRCDLGLNTAAFNESATLVERLNEHSHAMQAGEVDFTVQEWAEVFVDPALGARPDQVAEGIESNPDFKATILGGLMADTLEPDSWVPIIDRDVCQELADQLQTARDVAARYPTAADAVAAGFVPSTVYVPGKGAHYSNMANAADGAFDVTRPEMLMYDHQDDPRAHLMGMAYLVLFDEDGIADDEGFPGPSDRWHSHKDNCQTADGIAVAPVECEEGRAIAVEDINGWMLHAWVVPGCESDWGVFSGTNPRIPLIPPGTPVSDLAPGCNSGTNVTDPLAIDHSGTGPTLD